MLSWCRLALSDINFGRMYKTSIIFEKNKRKKRGAMGNRTRDQQQQHVLKPARYTPEPPGQLAADGFSSKHIVASMKQYIESIRLWANPPATHSIKYIIESSTHPYWRKTRAADRSLRHPQPQIINPFLYIAGSSTTQYIRVYIKRASNIMSRQSLYHLPWTVVPTHHRFVLVGVVCFCSA